ncbi:hypothetical protein KFL_003510110 [Klebsormidium nitens]|uniref:Enkurin domain-containing protein n=1 Tax=Klebsormidium nitens TaxID=105231 RepID=A0A1Y1IFB3_KLENI|nr:hypothetical protein KFL_003510110 [Klebsormidium nitens]|eukprot:GAQ87417.1 hypothetical protein KFL_003510110 [Klebsormidium nitens]
MMESGESVYALIPPAVETKQRPPIYRSLQPGEVDPSQFEMGCGTVKKAATFGPPRGTLKPSTNTYLRKHSKEPALPDPGPLSQTKAKLKPDLPKDRPIMGLVSAKNFVTANAIENILASPKKLKDAPPLATQKKDYGKVPGYLTKVKDQVKREKEHIEHLTQKMMHDGASDGIRHMSEEERQELIVGLKQKWQRINEAYQKMSFTLDTGTKKAKKEQYEAELAQIEKDIETLSRRVVLVAEEPTTRMESLRLR